MHAASTNVSLEQIGQFAQTFGVFALFALVSARIAYRLKLFSLSHLPPRYAHLPYFSFAMTLGAFVAFFAIQFFLFPGVDKLIQFAGEKAVRYKEVCYLLVIAAGMLAYAKLSLTSKQWASLWGGSLETDDIQSKRATWKSNFRSAAIGSLSWLIAFPTVSALATGLAIILVLCGYSPQEVELEQVAIRQLKLALEYPLSYFITSLLICTTVPLCEELLFRGFLQTCLKQALGRPTAIICTSLLFSAFHYSADQGIANAILLTSLFALSCFLGFLFERQRSLWGSIGLHATFNAMSILALTFT